MLTFFVLVRFFHLNIRRKDGEEIFDKKALFSVHHSRFFFFCTPY
jgi:hypothetical protein